MTDAERPGTCSVIGCGEAQVILWGLNWFCRKHYAERRAEMLPASQAFVREGDAIASSECIHRRRVQMAKPLEGFPPLPGKCEDCGATVPFVDCQDIAKGFDEIAKPAHYNQGQIQVWDFIVDQRLDYLAGCCVKYICRYRHKGTPLKDLKKAQAYLGKLIEQVEAQG